MTSGLSGTHSPAARIAATVFVILFARISPVAAQRGQARDSTVARLAYASLSEMLAALPDIAAPTLDEANALWLGALPLACLDRLQPRVPNRGGGAGRANADSAAENAVRDTAARRTAARGAQAGERRARGAGARGANPADPDTLLARGRSNNGAEYFWLPTYHLVPDYNRNRAFWGCSDWHSAVSSTWVAVKLLEDFPHLGLQELAREKLNDHLGKTNLAGEIAFFRDAAGAFERPYGYAWLLRLAAELRAWPDSQAQRWSQNMTPLASWMADSLVAALHALPRPVRTGGPTNTALGITLALAWASPASALHDSLAVLAHRFFDADTDCSTQSEAAAARGRGARGDSTAAGRGRGRAGGRAGGVNDLSRGNGRGTRGGGAGGGFTPGGGADIVSPCLTEAALMADVMEPAPFAAWLDAFLPPLQSTRFTPLVELPPDSSSSADAARFAALSFQRAQTMARIARALPASDARVPVLRRLSAVHADRAFTLMRADTSGTNWVPAFALLYFTSSN